MRKGLSTIMDLEWLILGDYATMADGKLYLQGGGWDRLTIGGKLGQPRTLGIAASVRVPWNETNRTGHLQIEVQYEDGQSLAKINSEFKVGRPAEIPEGLDQRAQVAGNLTMPIEKFGTYAIVASLEGEEVGRTSFYVVPSQQLAMQQAKERQQAEGDEK